MVTGKIPDLSISLIDFMTKLADHLVRSEVGMLLKLIRVRAQYVQKRKQNESVTISHGWAVKSGYLERSRTFIYPV